MKTLTIRVKLIVAFALLVVAISVEGAVAIDRLSTVNDASTEIAVNWLPSVRVLGELNTLTSDFRIAEGMHVMSLDKPAMDQAEAELANLGSRLDKAKKRYEGLISLDEERTIYATFLKEWGAYLENHKTLLVLSRDNQNAVAAALFKGNSLVAFNAASNDLGKLIDLNNASATAASNNGDEIYAAARTLILFLIGISVLFGVGAAWTIIQTVSVPLTAMTAGMRNLAAGDLSIAIHWKGRQDEIGAMAEALDVFKQNMIQTRDLTAQRERDQAEKEAQQEALRRHIQSFEGTVIGVLDGLTGAEHMLSEISNGVEASARDVKDRAGTALGSAQGASQSVETMAATAEELSSSVQEISRRVAEASSVAGKAVSEAEQTTADIRTLEHAVTKIGEIVDLITDIANQTNLLALNATIEAARAGDAGKGFAVVANEVKSLANQTARATGDIASQISQVQSATEGAVSAMGRIGAVINDINQISASIASAVEEQSAATGEIARSADAAARSTQEVAGIMGALNEAAEASGASAAEIARSSDQLSQQSAVLKEEVRTFLNRVSSSDDGTGQTSELVSWDETFNFGVTAIDDEHRHLMDITNRLYRDVKAGQEGQNLSSTFQRLRQYTTAHFKEEEAYMARIRYPAADEHKAHHDAFIHRLDSLFEKFSKGDKTAGMDLMAFMGSWWRNHIEGDDTKLARAIRDGGR